MSLRISSALAVLLLSACDAREDPTGSNANAVAQHADRAILCAHRGAPLRRVCSVDRTDDARGPILILRHLDGGFHRLLVTRDGRGVGAGYGAGTVIQGDGIEVTIDGDRYRLPATIGSRPS